MADMGTWQVYLVKCSDESLYCGITNNLTHRLHLHNLGQGAKYTRGRRPVTLVAQTSFMTRSQALKHEIAIKKLPAGQKIKALRSIKISTPE